MSYVKNYNVGQIQLDLPTSNYIHELPLLSFADIHGNVNLSLVFNYGLKAENSNPFNIAAGYKLNMQKRIVMSNSAPTAFQNESGKVVDLNSADTCYSFDDDTQRIIRRTDSAYEIENLDFSKELYDHEGNIIEAYDKYGALVLSYAYDSNDKLISITYRNDKTISFTYDSNNRLNSITYAGKTISLTYTTSGITLTHYTGVTFTLTSSGMNFSVTSTATENSTSVSYATSITQNGDYILAISNLINGSTVNTTTYKFPDIVTSYNTNVSHIEITDNFGVVTRIQYNDDKPCYSYELMYATNSQNEDIFFEDDNGNQIYKGTVSINTEEFSGVQGVNDGIRLAQLTSDYVSWKHTYTGTTSLYGNFIISGWIYAAEGSTYTITVKDIYSGKEFEGHTLTDLTPGMWNYFSFKTYMNNPQDIVVNVNKSSGFPICFDIRMMFEEGKIYSSSDFNHFTVMKDVLVKEGTDASNEKIIQLDNNLRFYSGNSQINERITADDILRYKINQKQGSTKNEIYYDHCRGVIANAGVFAVEYDEEVNGATQTTRINIEDVAVGKNSIRNEKTHLTKMNFYTDSDENSYFASKMYINDEEVKIEIYDDKFDIMYSKIDNVETTYTRENDLITSESVGDLYTRTTIYLVDDEGNPTITAIDEYNNTTVKKLDPVWGVVKYTLMPDGTVIADEYGSDMCTVIARTFTDSEGNSKTHTFEYVGGNLKSLTDGTINYNFTYSGGALSEVFKFDTTPIEKHVHSNGDKTLTSYYPKESGALYSIVRNTDKYGRLDSVEGELDNTYDINPVCSDSGVYTKEDIDNGSSKLAISKDLKTGNETKYTYENGRIKKVGVFNSSGTKVNEEELTYDAAGRITTDVFTYNNMSNSVQSDITYATETDSPTADGRVLTCSYKVNGTEKAKTQNRYNDNYKRLTAKLVTMGGYTYDKGFTYSKTRISRVMDVKNGSTFHNVSYGYDALGRITSESDSTDTSFNNTYVYDSCGRLIQENNKALDKTFVFKYNDNGNIIGFDTLAYTTANVSNANVTVTHVYDSTIKDRLKSFNGSSISYDSNGYPTYYNNKNYIWTKDKLTRIFRGNGSQYGSLYEYCNFAYDGYGRRTSKSYSYDPNPGSTSDYSYMYTTTYDYDASGRLIHEYCIERYTYTGGGSHTRDITYLYDESGIVGAIQKYNSTEETYYFDKNIKGDVIALYNSAGTKVASYIYDAWGNCTTKTLVSNNFSTYNPIRYRGYYYDRETGLYYLNARYYKPAWCRFISPATTDALSPQSISGLNLYAYAGNNPIILSYPSVEKSIKPSPISSESNLINTPVIKMPGVSKNVLSGLFSIANTHKSTNNIFRNLPRANFVKMSHVTESLIKDPVISKVIGNISYTQTWQMNDAAPVFSFIDIGNDGYNVGVGVNINNWIGYSVFATSAGGLGYTFQISPWFVFSSGWNRESGLSFGGGVIVDDITHELTISIGNGVLAALLVCAAISLIPVPGAKVAAAFGTLIIIDALI